MEVDSAAVGSAPPWTLSNLDQIARKPLGYLSTLSAQSSSKDLDWALIEITDTVLRFDILTLLKGEKYPETRWVNNIASTPTAKDDVFVATASSGVLNGVISGNSSFMLLPNTVAFQEMWTLHIDGRVGK